MGKGKEAKELEKRLEKEAEIRTDYELEGITLPNKCPMCNKSNLAFSIIRIPKSPEGFVAWAGARTYTEIVCGDCRYVMLFKGIW